MSNLNDKIIIHVVTGEPNESTETKKETKTMPVSLETIAKHLGVEPETKPDSIKLDRIFLETIKNHAENGASNDATKFHLNHVRVRMTEPEVVEITSSDGYKAVVSTLRIGPAADLFKGQDWFAEVDAAKNFKNLLKDKKELVFESVHKDGILSIASTNGFTTRLVSAKRAMIDYPKVENYMVQSFETEVAISFNVEYLMDIVKAAGRAKNPYVEIRFDPNKRNAIMVLPSTDGEVKTVSTLMPMRGAKTTPRLTVDAEHAKLKSSKKGA